MVARYAASCHSRCRKRTPMVMEAGVAATDGLPSAKVLPLVGSVAACGRRRCYHRWAPVLPAVGGCATTGGRRCYLQSLEVLPPVGVVAAGRGGGATCGRWMCYYRGRRCTYCHRRCCHRWVSLLPAGGKGATCGRWMCYHRWAPLLPTAVGCANEEQPWRFRGKTVVLPWSRRRRRCYEPEVNVLLARGTDASSEGSGATGAGH
jgi:hypothetical protein